MWAAEKSRANPLVPLPATISAVRELTIDVNLFQVQFGDGGGFPYRPGQFAFLSAFGVGEAPFSITSLNDEGGPMEFAIRRVGTVSTALHDMEPGSVLGVRGPFGNGFPLDTFKGKNLVIIGGGIGLAPLRPIIKNALVYRDDYGEVVVIYGARTHQDLVFASEFEDWAAVPGVRLELTVDREGPGWDGRVALVPAVIKELQPTVENAVAIICGPPIMIRFVLAELKAQGFENHQIVTTLESKMKCGIGKCARCNIGEKYVCQDGPVFTFDQISGFLEQI
ncbi:MAG: FAD/NAD(P)-binding protein [Dehalococcoidia bacterium]|nr:FAD/NAD(P)-binding protein [Dehalococcoidia bacterium]